jgi:tRNA(adenine34) deaminase
MPGPGLRWPTFLSVTPMEDPADAMPLAIEEAELALAHGDVPVGALVVVDGEILTKAHNRREELRDPTAHAELLAIRDASKKLGRWRLDDATVVVTLEPCAMCAGALVAGRMKKLVFGAFDPKAGACGSLYNLCSDPRLNHEVQIESGVLAEECGALLSEFFSGLRAYTPPL